jgi:hypothetical protein
MLGLLLLVFIFVVICVASSPPNISDEEFIATTPWKPTEPVEEEYEDNVYPLRRP